MLVALVLAGFVARRVMDNPAGDVETGFLYLLGRLYVFVFHGLRVHGREHVPSGADAGPLIIVSNHTAGVDPLLISAGVPFPVRWMMAENMRIESLEPFWRWQQVIFVSLGGRDSGVREAIRHLEDGGVLGIFPEGALERPPRQVLPFLRGVGLLIHRTKAPVLPVVIEGTPQADPAWASLWRPSRSRITFKPVIRYAETDLGAAEIVEDLRGRYLEWTGWPANDREAESLLQQGYRYPGSRVKDA